MQRDRDTWEIPNVAETYGRAQEGSLSLSEWRALAMGYGQVVPEKPSQYNS